MASVNCGDGLRRRPVCRRGEYGAWRIRRGHHMDDGAAGVPGQREGAAGRMCVLRDPRAADRRSLIHITGDWIARLEGTLSDQTCRCWVHRGPDIAEWFDAKPSGRAPSQPYLYEATTEYERSSVRPSATAWVLVLCSSDDVTWCVHGRCLGDAEPVLPWCCSPIEELNQPPSTSKPPVPNAKRRPFCWAACREIVPRRWIDIDPQRPSNQCGS